MDVHTADRHLVLVDRHPTDFPCYRRALTASGRPTPGPAKEAEG